MNKFLFFSSLFLVLISNLDAQVGTNDASFNPGTGSNSDILSVAVQSDGKILAAGTFTTFNGTSKNRIIRLNSNGTADATFTVGVGAINSVYKVGTLSSGKILACGQFTTYAGLGARRLVRINTNGTKDGTFNTSTGANAYINSFVEQPDGNVIVVGGFSTYGGVARSKVARVTSTGSNDATFAPGTGANNNINTVALQSDGKILIGGVFTSFNGTSRVRLARLTSTGANDATFVTGTGVVGTGTTAAVHSVVIQPDGKILVGGLFTTYNGTARTNLIRLNSNGSLDATFVTGTGPSGYVKQIILQPDGKIIIVGAFTSYNGTTKSRIVRLNTNGSIDNTFGGTGADNLIACGALQQDAELVIGGTFNNYSGVSRAKIARVHAACPTLTLSSTGHTNNLCHGGSTGSATVAVTGGIAFTYSWAPSGGTSAVATGLAAGSYTCTVYNECLNTATVSVTITEPTSVSVTTGATPTVCAGGNAVLSATASGGTGAFTYNWMPGNLSIANPTVNPTVNSTYTVIATDANGCTSTASTQNVDIYTAPTISISGGNTAICSGSSVTLTASGGLSYNWNTGSNTTTVEVNPVSTSNFTVTGTDASGCSNTAVKTITVAGTCATASVPCGLTVTNLNQTANATNVTGAVNYRFKFYNNATNALLATKVQSSRTFTFNTLSNVLFYGNTYKWTVSVDKGTGFGPESSNACTVTFLPPTATVPCGVSYSNLNTYSTCQFISAARNYRFSFYNNTTNALMAVKTQTSNYIYFNQVPGLAYGNTYKWTVEIEYYNGSAYVFGPASSNSCTITFNPPQVTVPCGNTYSKNAYTSVAFVSGANAYRYTFYDAGTNALIATTTNTNQYIYFNQVPGLILNKSYNWAVEVRYNNGSGNVFGPASSSSCIMNYGTPSSILINGNDGTTIDENTSARLAQQIIAGESNEFWVNAYPNPAKNKVNITASETIKEIKVYSISGELVSLSENINEIDLSNLNAGIYIISIQTENNLKHIRITKE